RRSDASVPASPPKRLGGNVGAPRRIQHDVVDVLIDDAVQVAEIVVTSHDGDMDPALLMERVVEVFRRLSTRPMSQGVKERIEARHSAGGDHAHPSLASEKSHEE